MYLDIPANPNLDEPTMATFKEDGAAVPVHMLRLWRDGSWRWCAVTGMSENGPVNAYIQPIEESGDGPAQLVHGGTWGLRLREGEAPEHWDVSDPTQWGEAFLLITPEAEWR